MLASVDGIHPVYGFLAENTDYSELCNEFQITFIAPSPESIRKIGIKDVARKTMEDAGIQIVPGSDGIIKNNEDGLLIAERIGFPVIIKTTAGGGGKGIRVAHDRDELK
jgi:acetyl-CoA carboxylase biotin carboxylase subunit